MVKVVTQETFDEYVRENMEEFDMSKEEAIQEAKDQLLTQGVNLANIVMGLEEDAEVVKSLKLLKDLNLEEGESKADTFVENCRVVEEECAKGMAEKVLAEKHDGYKVLVQALKTMPSDQVECRVAGLKALSSLMDKNPDVFDPEGFIVLTEGLDHSGDPTVIEASLDLALSAIVLHEMNRQNLVKNNLLEKLSHLADQHPLGVSRVWQAMVQDDDVRVTAGNAHQTARTIVEESKATIILLKCIKDHLSVPSALKQFLSTLSSLTVRNEYCQQVADDGGLEMAVSILSNEGQAKPVITETLKLLKTLAGNDNVKNSIREAGIFEHLVATMSRHMGSGGIIHAGCGVITATCLRTPKNAEKVIQHDGAMLLVTVLQSHMKTASIMTACCNAIRNLVSRSKHLSEKLVPLGVESLINQVLKTHSGAAGTTAAAKAALRDLDLKVHLKEEWTGSSQVTVVQSQESSIKDIPEELCE